MYMALCINKDCHLWIEGRDECACDDCVDERDVTLVSTYASTCDHCGGLTHHDELVMDDTTQLGYCPACVQTNKHQIQKICSVCHTVVPYPETVEEQDTWNTYCKPCATKGCIIEQVKEL